MSTFQMRYDAPVQSGLPRIALFRGRFPSEAASPAL